MSAFIPLPPGYRAYWHFEEEDAPESEPVVGVWQDDDGLLPSFVTMSRDGELSVVEHDYRPLVVLAPGEELKLGEIQQAREFRERLRQLHNERQVAAR